MLGSGREPLLSNESYDQDAASVISDLDGESQTDVDEPYNPTHEPNEEDRELLTSAGEEGQFPKASSRFNGIKNTLARRYDAGRSKRLLEQRAQRERQAAEGGADAELIYEMEGGYKDNSSRSSSESLALVDEKWNQEPKSGKPFLRILSITIAITMLFIVLSYGSYVASNRNRQIWTFSNGTHAFGPTTILISLDGFRADFLQRGLTPAMKAFVESGVSPRYMLPSFPSLTFPNHFTLVTGLYPESHGIVGNQFWDPNLKEEFYYTNISNSMQPKWWNAEPIWATAQKAGLKTAIHMWPGSEAHIGNCDPTYLDKYKGDEALEVKVDRILSWLDLPQDKRPQLIGAYVPNVDSDGHKYGPNSTDIRATIVEVDSMLTSLIQGLYERNLTEIVNLVIVSDHGMATTSNDRLIQLDDFIDMSLIDHIDGWPLRGLRLKNPNRDITTLHQQLLAASKGGSFDVYTRETMPERFHFSNNDRIAPLWVIPHTGWAIVEKEDFDIVEARISRRTYEPIGLHGYDHEHPLMRAIFIARGPAFPHSPNSRVAAFQNIEVYNIVCDSLGITPQPNNGTLRLPLQTEGLHTDFEPDKAPADPVEFNQDESSEIKGSVTSMVATKSYQAGPSSTKNVVTSTDKEQAKPTTDAGSVPTSPVKTKSNWWDFLHNQLDKAKEWAKDLIDSIRNNKASSKEEPV